MNWIVPTWWQFTLLALTAVRITRFVGWDVLTRPIRESLVGRYEEGSGKKARDTERGKKLGNYHRKLDEWIHCPWCLGAWVSTGGFLLWEWHPHIFTVIATPWAVSAVVGLVVKNLDK